jgi:hypothetical protein
MSIPAPVIGSSMYLVGFPSPAGSIYSWDIVDNLDAAERKVKDAGRPAISVALTVTRVIQYGTTVSVAADSAVSA